jgi:hypothetical protein
MLLWRYNASEYQCFLLLYAALTVSALLLQCVQVIDCNLRKSLLICVVICIRDRKGVFGHLIVVLRDSYGTQHECMELIFGVEV